MFDPDFPGRSIFCDILQKPSPLIDHVDFGDGIIAKYDKNIQQLRVINPTDSEKTTKNLISFISWKTLASIKLTVYNEIWALVCDWDSLEKIGELVLIKLNRTITWIKSNNKFFLFFKGIHDGLESGTYAGMQIHMPSVSRSFEIKIDAFSSGANLFQTPYLAPEILIEFLNDNVRKTQYLPISNQHQWTIIKPDNRNQTQKPSLLPLKRGMTINNKRTIYKRDHSILVTKDERENTRAAIRELLKLNLHVGFRNPKEKWFYFKEEISGLKFGATNDELTLCYYLEECPPYVEPLYRTGEKFGLIVVDADVKNGINGIKNFVNICTENGFDPYKTLLVLTPSGGIHFIFKYPRGYDIPCSENKIAYSVDIRANDGVAGAPGYIRRFGRGAGNAYMIINDVTPIDYPDFLIQLTRKHEPTIKKPCPRNPHPKLKIGHSTLVSTSTGEMAALDELAIAAHIVSTTAPGSRNSTLYKKAFKLGCLVCEGRLPKEMVITRLQAAALECGLDDREIMPTIQSGLNGASEYKTPSSN